ncbi:hypothetical protein [Methanosarcina sp.]|uniref:hypothetical protein n=1 Tax=Methanosarcina sp. TaxID=2213 RepID=UPI003BB718CB
MVLYSGFIIVPQQPTFNAQLTAGSSIFRRIWVEIRKTSKIVGVLCEVGDQDYRGGKTRSRRKNPKLKKIQEVQIY